MSYQIKSKIWIEHNSQTYLGEGRIRLMQQIIKLGSISAAAKSMKMSYKKAWEMIDSINKSSKKPLVIKVTGGKGGGGTQVTAEGIKTIAIFENLNKKCQQFLDKEIAKINL